MKKKKGDKMELFNAAYNLATQPLILVFVITPVIIGFIISLIKRA